MKGYLNFFRISRKLKNKSGETIAETLVTMVILSLAVLMLAGAVVSAAKVNKKADNTSTSFTVGTEVPGSGTNSPTVTITQTNGTGGTGTSTRSATLPVKVYETKNKYIYYEAGQQ